MKFPLPDKSRLPFQWLYTGFFLLLLSFTSGYSQQSWGLKQCVDYAIQHNIQLRQTILSSELSKINYMQSKAAFLPTLNGSASHNYNFGRSVDQVSYTYTTQQIQSNNFSLNSGITLFSGFQLMNQLKQSKLDFQASEYEIKKIANDVSLNVVATYLQVLFAEESVTSSKDRVDAAIKQRARTKLMVDAGNMAQGSLLDAEALVSSEQLAQVTSENLLQAALLTLTQLLELDSARGFKIERPPVDLPDQAILASTEEEIYQLALKTLPEIKSAEFKNLSAEKGLSLAKGGLYPRLTMYGGLSSGYSNVTQRLAGLPIYQGLQPNGQFTAGGEAIYEPFYTTTFEKTPFSAQVNDNLGKSIGFNLSIPLFNGFQTQAGIKKAKLNVLNTRFTYDLSKKLVFKSIQQAKLDALSALNKFQAATRNFEAQKLALDYADKKFNVGLLSSLDIINTRNNKAKAESDLLQAKYDLIFKIKILEFYSGKPLSL